MPDASAEGVAASARPNIIHIVLDDLGYADLGCYGGAAVDTPNIDRLAERGTRFTQAYAGAPVCAPSRSVLMTGRHTGNTPVRGNTGGIPLDPGVDTVADVLSAAGYATGGFGKWGLGDIDTEGVPEANGFDEFYGYYHQVHAHSYYPAYLVDTGERVDQGGERLEKEDATGGVDAPGRTYSHYAVVDRMAAFVEEHAGSEDPFYCYAPWTPPHGPMQIPADDPAWRRYADEPWPEDHRVAAAMIAMVDRGVGDLVERLDAHGVAEETLVLFSSDHGAGSRREGTLDSCGVLRGGKRDVYEGGIRTPLVATWPGHVPAGRVSYHPCHYADVLPTLAELAGVPEAIPAGVDGHSIVPELLGPDAVGRGQPEHEYLYWSLPRVNWDAGRYAEGGLEQAVRAGDWKLLRHNDDEPWELYNLSTDPGETADLADAKPDVRERLLGHVETAGADRGPRLEPETPEGKRFR